MSCCASFSSASLTSMCGMSTSLIGRTSFAYSSCCMTRPSATGRIMTMYCLPRAAQRPIAQRFLEQRIRFRAALVGREVVGLVEEHRIDRRDRHELVDVGGAGAGFLH